MRNSLRVIFVALSLLTFGLMSSPVADTSTVGVDSDILQISLPLAGNGHHRVDTVEISHCGNVPVKFVAEGLRHPRYPLTWTSSFGEMNYSGTGQTAEWYWWEAPQRGVFALTVTVSDARGRSSSRRIHVRLTNQSPVIPDGPRQPVVVGRERTQWIDAVDDCDFLNWSIVDRGGATGRITLAQDYGEYGAGYSPITVIYTPDPADVGLRTFVLAVSDGDPSIEPVTCEIQWNVTDTTFYQVAIETSGYALQGQFHDVAVTLNGADTTAGYGLGGFDLLVAYDNYALNFQSAREGDIYDACGWEYFTYRFGANGDCGDSCPSGLTRIIGIAETNNGPHHPNCDIDSLPVTLTSLRFLVSNDRTWECQFAPIRFFWIDCGDNVLANMAGDKLFVSADVFDPYDGITWPEVSDGTFGFPTYFGSQDECLVRALPGKPLPTRQVDFYNGGVQIACADSIDIDLTGDINLNGLAFEIVDAMMFANYFVHGLAAFGTHSDASTAASDVNRNGVALTVSDLVYMFRVVVGDLLPSPLLEPDSTICDLDGDTLFVDDPMGSAYLVFEGTVSPTLLATNMTMKVAERDGQTHVLIYSMTANQTFDGPFVHADGRLLSYEFATYDGQPVVAKPVELPKSYALHQNYPNPFNPTTWIDYELPQAADVTLDVFNLSGQHVATLVSGYREAGVHTAEWDATGFASGIYLYRLQAGAYSGTRKMVLLK